MRRREFISSFGLGSYSLFKGNLPSIREFDEGVSFLLVESRRLAASVGDGTTSDNWPIPPGMFQPNPGGGSSDLVICKIRPDGTIVACSYLGGSGHENAEGMSVDSTGNVYVTGTTHAAIAAKSSLVCN